MSDRFALLGSTAAATVVLALLACYAWATPTRSRLSPGPKAFVQRYDRVVQARFQDARPGEFGPVRILGASIGGHATVTGLVYDETASEKQILKPLRKSPYFVIVGIMHLRHKPGLTNVDEYARLSDPIPSARVLEVSGTTARDAERNVGLGEVNIERATLWAARRVKSGEAVDTTYGKFAVAIRPIRAEHAGCITCHTGSKRNDVLGAMIYMVAPTRHNTPAKVFTTGIYKRVPVHGPVPKSAP